MVKLFLTAKYSEFLHKIRFSGRVDELLEVYFSCAKDKFGFSRPDLDRNKLAKGISLASVYLVVPRVVNFFTVDHVWVKYGFVHVYMCWYIWPKTYLLRWRCICAVM